MVAKRPPHFHYHNAYHALDVLPNIPIHHLPLKMIKLLAILLAIPKARFGVAFRSNDNQLSSPMKGKMDGFGLHLPMVALLLRARSADNCLC
jgi:hypothetical protein